MDEEHLHEGPLPLGLHLELARPDIGRSRSSGAERALDPRAPPVRGPAIPPTAVLLLGLLLAAKGAIGAIGGQGGLRLGFVGSIGTLGDLATALLAVPLTFVLLRWTEAVVVSSELPGGAPVARWISALPRTEPVAWRVGPSTRTAAAPLGLGLSLYLLGAGWHALVPAVCAGVGGGALLYLVGALYPLEPGPGTRILERLTGAADLSDRLRWSLVERFLPVPSPVRVRGTAALAWASAALAAWAAGTGGVLYLLSLPPGTGATFPGRLWQLAAALGLVGYTAWLVVRTGSFVADALRLGRSVSLEPLVPPEELVSAWREDNPLLSHVGELEGARWSWKLAPQGTLLGRHGGTDRRFYWLARGEVRVVARSSGGDPVQESTLGAGVGIGEEALLDGTARDADVVAARDSVVAVLDHADFDAVADDGVRRRVREVVLASRALARSDVFWGLGPEERSRWLAHGEALREPARAALVRQGEEERWIGLVVRGSVSVERNGDVLAELGPDSVFGEMAYLDGGARTATLRVREPAVVWRWEPTWLDEALARTDLREVLRALAEERGREGG